ncbi:MAG TPA: MFS transporter [Alphaproteobacteria bacterium]|nr:MFS transporter [Alphaproteobacteria bacterium]
MREKGQFSAWLVVGVGFFALALSFSARAALGLAMPIWERELGWTREFVSFGGALALIVMASVAPFAGNLVDHRGPRLLLFVGMIATGAGMLIVATAASRWQFLLGFAAIAAVGFGIVATHVIATAIAKRFEEGRGLATGIGTAGATGGQLVIMPLLAIVLQMASWRLGFAVLGIASLMLGAVVLIASDRDAASSAGDGGEVEALRGRLLFLIRSPVFHVLFWSFLICGFTTTGVIETHLLPYAAACGFPPLPSAAAYGVLSGVNLAGMIASGWLTDRWDRPVLLAGIYIVRAFCFILLFFIAGDFPLLLIFAVLFGLVDYATVPVTASLVASHLGLRVMGLAMGVISAGHAVGGALGAFLGGWLFDDTGTYRWVWMISIALAVIAGLLVLVLRETRVNGRPAYA